MNWIFTLLLILLTLPETNAQLNCEKSLYIFEDQTDKINADALQKFAIYQNFINQYFQFDSLAWFSAEKCRRKRTLAKEWEKRKVTLLRNLDIEYLFQLTNECGSSSICYGEGMHNKHYQSCPGFLRGYINIYDQVEKLRACGGQEVRNRSISLRFRKSVRFDSLSRIHYFNGTPSVSVIFTSNEYDFENTRAPDKLRVATFAISQNKFKEFDLKIVKITDYDKERWSEQYSEPYPIRRIPSYLSVSSQRVQQDEIELVFKTNLDVGSKIQLSLHPQSNRGCEIMAFEDTIESPQYTFKLDSNSLRKISSYKKGYAFDNFLLKIETPDKNADTVLLFKQHDELSLFCRSGAYAPEMSIARPEYPMQKFYSEWKNCQKNPQCRLDYNNNPAMFNGSIFGFINSKALSDSISFTLSHFIPREVTNKPSLRNYELIGETFVKVDSLGSFSLKNFDLKLKIPFDLETTHSFKAKYISKNFVDLKFWIADNTTTLPFRKEYFKKVGQIEFPGYFILEIKYQNESKKGKFFLKKIPDETLNIAFEKTNRVMRLSDDYYIRLENKHQFKEEIETEIKINSLEDRKWKSLRVPHSLVNDSTIMIPKDWIKHISTSRDIIFDESIYQLELKPSGNYTGEMPTQSFAFAFLPGTDEKRVWVWNKEYGTQTGLNDGKVKMFFDFHFDQKFWFDSLKLGKPILKIKRTVLGISQETDSAFFDPVTFARLGTRAPSKARHIKWIFSCKRGSDSVIQVEVLPQDQDRLRRLNDVEKGLLNTFKKQVVILDPESWENASYPYQSLTRTNRRPK